jgi:addiction module HigA family antidote
MSERLPNIHPGEVLEEEFLKPMGISRYRLAKDIGVPPPRVAEICHRRRAITADTALRLARYFGTTSRFWMGLQEDYDLEKASRGAAKALRSIRPVGVRRVG